MTEPDRELFPLLEPPPGGLSRLRARIDRGRRRRHALAIVTTAAAVLALTWFVSQIPNRAVEIQDPGRDAAAALLENVEHPALVDWGREAAPEEPVFVHGGAVTATRVATRSNAVVMYRLE